MLRRRGPSSSCHTGCPRARAGTLFPGFQPLPNYTIPALKAVSSAALQAYANALAAAQSQDAELTGENFGGIESASAGTTYTLTAIQSNTEAALASSVSVISPAPWWRRPAASKAISKRCRPAGELKSGREAPSQATQIKRGGSASVARNRPWPENFGGCVHGSRAN
jgi:hypothetical protein